YGPMASFTNLGDLIRRDRDGTKTAIIDLGGEAAPREFSYRQIDAMGNGVARALGRRGFVRGDRIAILSANRTEFLAAYYGIMRAGLVAVPVNFKFPRSTIHFILADAGAKLAFCDGPRRADVPAHIPSVGFDDDGPDGFEAFLDPRNFDAVVPRPREPAMFLYTSGSTRTPEGGRLPPPHQPRGAAVRRRPLGAGRRLYPTAARFYHRRARPLTTPAGPPHAAVVLRPRSPPPAYIAAIGRYRPTWLTAVPPMIAMMLRERDALARTD